MQPFEGKLCEQTFSCLTSIESKDRKNFISTEDEHVYAVSICARKNSLNFHIKKVSVILYFSLKNNSVLVSILVHIALIYLIFSVTILFKSVNKCSCCM
jgi:hypothetical protein